MTKHAQLKPLSASWENILSCSHQLLDMAKQSQWDDMTSVATQRDTLIKLYFSNNPANEKNAEMHRLQIKNILEMDENILNYYNGDYKNLSENLQSLRNSSKALSAYHNCP